MVKLVVLVFFSLGPLLIVGYCTLKPSVHWQHRKLRGDALKQALALIAAGLEPKDIVSALYNTLDIPY